QPRADLEHQLEECRRELAEAREQQTATSEVLQVISSSPGELQLVFDAVLANATRLCEASYAILWLREGDQFRTGAFYGGLPPAYVERWPQGTLVPLDPNTPWVRAIQTRQPVQVADYAESRAYLERDPLAVDGVEVAGIRTLVAVPMLRENEAIGSIAIYRTEGRPFSEKQVELGANFARPAGIAIGKTRLLNELARSLQQQTATADVLKVVSRSTLGLQTVLSTLVESAARLCEAESAHIFRRTETDYELAACRGYSREYEEYMRRRRLAPGRDSLVGRIALEGRMVHIPDILADSEYNQLEAARLGRWRTMIGVPLLREGTAIGALTLTRSVVQPFTDKQIELLTTFADQAVIGIENVRLFDEVQARTEELSESLEQQTATSEVLQVISSSPGELQPVFDAMLVNATRICEAKFGMLYRCEQDGLRAVALHGASPQLAEERRRNPVIRPAPMTALGRALATRKPVQIVNVQDVPNYFDVPPGFTSVQLAKLAGARTILAVPMVKESELVGAIVIFRQEVRAFTDKQVELLGNFAKQAGIGIETTRLLNDLRQRTDDLSESLEQQTATGEILASISGSVTDTKPVFDAIVRNLRRLFGTRMAMVQVLKHGKVHLAAAAHELEFETLNQQFPRPLDESTGSGLAMLSKQVLQFAPVLRNPAAPPATQQFARELGFNAVIYA